MIQPHAEKAKLDASSTALLQQQSGILARTRSASRGDIQRRNDGREFVSYGALGILLRRLDRVRRVEKLLAIDQRSPLGLICRHAIYISVIPPTPIPFEGLRGLFATA